MKKERESKLDVSVKGNIRDLLAFKNLISDREKKISKAPDNPIDFDPINKLVQELHPKKQYLIIDEIKEESKSTKTFKLVPDPSSETKGLAYFRAGQYLSLRVLVDDVSITRPYSLSSSPSDALDGFYLITIRNEENGFLTDFIWKNWRVGTKIESSGPEGNLYYDQLRDSEYIVGIAGGTGINPFMSIAKEIATGSLNAHLTLLYGSSKEDDIIFYDDFKKLEEQHSDRIKVVVVLSCEEITLDGCEKGFITAEIIKKYVDIDKSSFFICGPQELYNFIDSELEKLNIIPKRIRKEVYGEVKEIIKYSEFPKNLAERSFKIKVKIGNVLKEIPALSTESVLVAMERANLAPPSKCRSGECGFCRSALLSGRIYINPKTDLRRNADKLYNYFHPCSSYPISDIEIDVPRKL
ncbi:MAG: FAD-binding oxidoreductase [Promethearchaeota archaeon]